VFSIMEDMQISYAGHVLDSAPLSPLAAIRSTITVEPTSARRLADLTDRAVPEYEGRVDRSV